MNSKTNTQTPSPRATKEAQRKKGRAEIQKWFQEAKRQDDEMVVLSYISQHTNLKAGGGDTAEGLASGLIRTILVQLDINYTTQQWKDKATADFPKKPGFNQRFTNMGVIQYFRHAAEYLLMATAWDSVSLPAVVHLTGNTVLNVDRSAFAGEVLQKKFEKEIAEADGKGGGANPQVTVRRIVLYLLKPIWAGQGLQAVVNTAYKANVPDFTGKVLTNAGVVVELFPKEHGPGLSGDIGTRKGWVAMELLYFLWLDMEKGLFQ